MLSIEKDACYGSSVKRINISHRIEELKNGWCNFVPKLNSIIISEENKNFSYLNDERKVIMGICLMILFSQIVKFVIFQFHLSLSISVHTLFLNVRI